jgi:diguanylate cyclase (GGDEF)-like protein
MTRRVWRFVMMIALVVFLAASLFVNFKRQAATAKILAVDVKTSSWAAAQLEVDFLQLQNALEVYQSDPATWNALWLRFELLWSRLNVLEVGSETEKFRELEESRKVLKRLKALLTNMDADFQGAEQGGRALLMSRMSDIKTQMADLYPAIRSLHMASYTNQTRLEHLENIGQLERLTLWLLLALMAAGFALVYMVIRESQHNRRLAMHDPMTGLANRIYFNVWLKRLAETAEANNNQVALHVIDLNGLKVINDAYGHAIGDEFLLAMAGRLKHFEHYDQKVARLGGDEFAVIQGAVTDLTKVEGLAMAIYKTLSQPLTIKGIRFNPKASVGVCLYPRDAETTHQTLLNADIAMYRAKSMTTHVCVFDHSLVAEQNRYKTLAHALDQAIESNALELHFQPLLDLKNGEVVGAEALIRWKHATLGQIPPQEIVSIAERSGLAETFNQWVLLRACQQGRRWFDEGYSLSINVNISPAMYTKYDLVASVDNVLKLTGFPAAYLTLEVTEDTTMRELEHTPDLMERLCQLGVKLALDDFGTGYSSLSHLKSLPVSRLKIDKSFVWDLDQTGHQSSFISTMVQLAQGLNIMVVAEGIESEAHYNALRSLGCDYGQGYFFSRPVRASVFDQLLIASEQGGLIPSLVKTP